VVDGLAFINKTFPLTIASSSQFKSPLSRPKSKPNLSSVRAGRLLESVPMAAKLTIGFLGAGKMATALAKGFLRRRACFPQKMSSLATSALQRATAFSKETALELHAVAKSAPILV